jgi:hypothetical protein
MRLLKHSRDPPGLQPRWLLATTHGQFIPTHDRWPIANLVRQTKWLELTQATTNHNFDWILAYLHSTHPQFDMSAVLKSRYGH